LAGYPPGKFVWVIFSVVLSLLKKITFAVVYPIVVTVPAFEFTDEVRFSGITPSATVVVPLMDVQFRASIGAEYSLVASFAVPTAKTDSEVTTRILPAGTGMLITVPALMGYEPSQSDALAPICPMEAIPSDELRNEREGAWWRV
jgi:hypothetical protein